MKKFGQQVLWLQSLAQMFFSKWIIKVYAMLLCESGGGEL